MKIFWFRIFGMTVTLQPTKSGLDFVTRFRVPTAPEFVTRVRLKWSEALVLSLLTALGSSVFMLADLIANSWLISKWAPDNLAVVCVVLAGGALLAGITLALWKDKQLLMYSLAELIFGTCSVFQLSWYLWPHATIAQFIGIGSALYVISRGAGNFNSALKTEGFPDRFATKVIPKLNERLTSLSEQLEEETDATKAKELQAEIQRILDQMK